MSHRDTASSVLGFTLVEVMISMALLTVSVAGGISSMVFVKTSASINNLQSVALFTAEQAIEELRATGKEILYDRLVLDDSGEEPIWIYDPTSDDMISAQVLLRRGYKLGESGEYVVDTANDVLLTQECLVLAPDNAGTADTLMLTVILDVTWAFMGRTYTDSIQTIIE